MTTPPLDARIWDSLYALADQDPRKWASVDVHPDYVVIVHKPRPDGTVTDAWGITEAELAELEDRGWIEHGEEGHDDEGKIQVTRQGQYWLGRWLKQYFREKRCTTSTK